MLPYHHTYEAVCGILVSLHHHSTICVNDSLRHVAENMKFFKPDYILLVPLFVENLYKKIMSGIEAKGKAKAFEKLIKTSNAMRKVGIDMRKTLFKSVHDVFGGEIIKLVCGGAPIKTRARRILRRRRNKPDQRLRNHRVLTARLGQPRLLLGLPFRSA